MNFCIPYDLADDPSRARGKQARERFEEAKQDWLEFAPGVEVGLLSGGELLERLALERHRGREHFFFGERLLGSEWCEHELKATIEDAGDRYTPEQDVALPIDEILESVAQPPWLEAELRKKVDAALLAAKEVLRRGDPERPWAGLPCGDPRLPRSDRGGRADCRAAAGARIEATARGDRRSA